MEYLIVGGDRRMSWLARLLSERGRDVAAWGLEPQPGVAAAGPGALRYAGNVVVNCPPKMPGRGLGLREVLEAVPAEARVFACSPGHPGMEDDRVIDLWADEALKVVNARLTAEGAVASAMRASSRALGETCCLVVGWGRIGRALTELLVAMGSRVTVASRSETGRNRAVERGAESADTDAIAEALPGHGLIFNTAPALVLDAAALRHADRDAMIIDLASAPYGVDLHAAWSRGLRAWREPGLPGRYCPQSAALAILKAMERHGA